MTPKNGFMQSWTEKSSLREQVSSLLSSPAKLGYLADLVCKTRAYIKGQGCNFNLDPSLFLRYYRLYLSKTLIREVTTKVTTVATPGCLKPSLGARQRSRHHSARRRPGLTPKSHAFAFRVLGGISQIPPPARERR